MVLSNLRPLLLMIAGAAVGSLLTFGLLGRHPAVPVEANGEKSDTPPSTLRAPSSTKQPDYKNQLGLNADTQDIDDSEETVNSQEAAAIIAANQRVPMRPIPKPTITFQANGLPVGVKPDAGVSDVYKRLPGVQPPLINRDGRDLGPEALQMLQNRTEMPFPGGTAVSSTPTP
jgi:hypothetical protein